MLNEADLLSDADFPTGLSRPLTHPKPLHLLRLVKEHANEYREAAQKSEGRSYGKRRMRSKTEIISLVVNTVMPATSNNEEKRGYFKKRRPDGTWAIHAAYENHPQRFRKRVSNEFNKYLKEQMSLEVSMPPVLSKNDSDKADGLMQDGMRDDEWEDLMDVRSLCSCDVSFCDLSDYDLSSEELAQIINDEPSSMSPSTAMNPSLDVLCDNDEDVSWKPDTVGSILKDMRENLEDADLQQSCCRLLGDIVRFGSVDDGSFVGLKASNTILGAMKFHKGDITVQRMACYALGQWACGRSTSQTAIVAAGCYASILTAMRSHLKNAKVQSYACFALAHTMQDHVANQSASGSVACIQAAISVMQMHQDDSEVQYYGCLALGNMVRNHRGNQSIIGAVNGGVKVVLKAMKHHSHDASVQSNSCKALGCLVLMHPTNRSEAIAPYGALLLIITSMDRHQYNPEVQCDGCFALGCLAYNNPGNQAAFVAAKVREKAVSLLERFSEHAKVVEASCHLLYSCCLLVVKTPDLATGIATTTNVFDYESLSMEAYKIISAAVQKHWSSNRQIYDCGRILLRNMPNDVVDLT